MALFINWIDVQLIVNDKFVPAFYSLLDKDEFVQERLSKALLRLY
jgi:hypothetical protein